MMRRIVASGADTRPGNDGSPADWGGADWASVVPSGPGA